MHEPRLVVSSNREMSDVEQAGNFDLSERRFDLSGGALCLDFANTLDDRSDPRPNDFLHTYADLLAFARQTGSLSGAKLTRLVAESAARPAAAAASLARAVRLRETIFQLFLALAEGQATPPGDLADLNRALAEALVNARLVETDRTNGNLGHGAADDRGVGRAADPYGRRLALHAAGGWSDRFTWTWLDEPLSLDTPLWPVARSAAELLTSSELSALRLCASDRCAWLFLDTSRNGSRRWCSMRTCGNRAKARRHHARVRASAATTER